MLPLRTRKERLMAEAWVSVDEVATHFGVAKESVYRWIEHKGLPAHKIGRLWKYQLSEVDAWVRACGATSPQSAPAQEASYAGAPSRRPRASGAR